MGKASASALAALPAYTIKCNGKETDLGELLPALAKKVSGVKYVYGDTDCSGMYHRLHLELAKKCKDYEAPARVPSRQVARRFFDAGELLQIADPLKSADLIKPGAVIFFGYRQNDYTNIKTDDLFVRGKGIVHIGVVVKVEKKEGRVVRYHMYHGRSKGKPSGVTTWHVAEAQVRRGQKYPSFGNGRQPWIAFARMAK